MILDKLIEKKDILIYTEQRINRLKRNANEINDRLRDPCVSITEKKSLMNGKRKIIGRIKELTTLRYVVSNGVLKAFAKMYWDDNYHATHSSGENRQSAPSANKEE